MIDEEQSGGSRARIALLLAAISLLFCARSALVSLFFPLLEPRGSFSFGQISALLVVLNFSQAAWAPLSGCLRWDFRAALPAAIAIGIAGVIVLGGATRLPVAVVGVLAVGLALTTGRLLLQADLLAGLPVGRERHVLSIRAMALNLGSLVGSAGGVYALYAVGVHGFFPLAAAVLGCVALAALFKAPVPTQPASGALGLRQFLSRRALPFWSDASAILLCSVPYGCWGTIIPKYAIDAYGSRTPVALIAAVSASTTLLFSYACNVAITRWRRSGAEWTELPLLARRLFIAGLAILTFARRPWALCLAVFVFIIGENVFAPCIDEIALRNGHLFERRASLGALAFIDAVGRSVGAAAAFFLYARCRAAGLSAWYWPTAVIVFVVLCTSGQALFKSTLRWAELRSDDTLGGTELVRARAGGGAVQSEI